MYTLFKSVKKKKKGFQAELSGSLWLFTGKSTEGPVSLWAQLTLGEGEISVEHLTCQRGDSPAGKAQ